MDAKHSSSPDTPATRLLAWYDRHARDLPWRSKPGEVPDPYRVWLSEVMLQQTTVAAVTPRFTAWVARWPDVVSLAAASDEDIMAAWAGLGYYARARNLVKAARAVVAEHGGRFPTTEAGLRALPGLGAYTAAAVAAIAFGERAVVVDANVERVVARLFAITTPLPAARPAIREATDRITPDTRAGDFAQAMMDLGSSICTVKKPQCLLCPIAVDCRARAEGGAETLPAKAPKKARPYRHGTVFWIEQKGRVWLVRRPDKGMLGGMRALPTGPWVDERPGLADAPGQGPWTMLNETVVHGFTHFELELALARTEGEPDDRSVGEWWPIGDLGTAGLPTLFARAADLLKRA
ncbi:A/G-specific adenine glycosylase [Sphingomonas sanguinis]|uniref:A/G-specific adenine glycosylase n=1 Tax=Sphingomonas sanguinis TaxID=33051 RepID=A0ABU5LUD1_9SPHN|nr:A/G-specific adenine glycosylase [Sphingomonas sanguinis]MDZ7283544.1 A/G-specific adenine glycosylase [Sphingomonas sanguinis]QXT37128.1 A/G-specific adenine glycosylase [Sphingomonas sanguinis]